MTDPLDIGEPCYTYQVRRPDNMTKTLFLEPDEDPYGFLNLSDDEAEALWNGDADKDRYTSPDENLVHESISFKRRADAEQERSTILRRLFGGGLRK